MKSNSQSQTSAAAASSAVADITNSATIAEASISSSSGDCETVSRRYQAQVLGITIFGVVGFVVFIKYVVTKYFAELEATIQQQQHTEF